ncbi:MAG: hypothetical protein WBM61_18010, partial [Woeseiaceae bacterium]
MKTKKKAVLLLVFVAALAAVQQAYSRQDPGPEPTSTAASVEAIDVQIANVEAAIADYKRLQELADASEPGLQKMLRRRMDNVGLSATVRVNRLAEDLIARAAKGDIAQSYKDRTVAWLETALRWISDGLDRDRADIVARLYQESSISPADAAESAVEMDSSFSAGIQSLQSIVLVLDNLENLGIDVSERRQSHLDRLRELAEMLAIAIELDTENLQKLRFRFSLSPDDADLKILVKVADHKRDSFARNLAATSDMLKKLGDDPSEYRRMVLVVTGDVASQILDTGVMSSLAKQWSKAGWDGIATNGFNVIFKIIVFVLIVVGFRALSL